MHFRSNFLFVSTVLIGAAVSASCSNSTAPGNADAQAKTREQDAGGQGVVLGTVVTATGTSSDTVFTPVPGALVSAYLYVYGPGTGNPGGGNPGGGNPGSGDGDSSTSAMISAQGRARLSARGDSSAPPTQTVTLVLVATTTADQTGHFTLTGLAAGTYAINAVGPAGSSFFGSTTFQSSGTNTVTVQVAGQSQPPQPSPPQAPPSGGDSLGGQGGRVAG